MKTRAIRLTLIIFVLSLLIAGPVYAKSKKSAFKPQFEEKSLTLYSGDSYTLKLKKTAPKTPKYSTANKKVVTVGSKSKTGVKLTAKNVKKKTKVKIVPLMNCLRKQTLATLMLCYM